MGKEFPFGKMKSSREFPGSPMVKTLYGHCKGQGFDPWSGN